MQTKNKNIHLQSESCPWALKPTKNVSLNSDKYSRSTDSSELIALQLKELKCN